MTFDAAEAPELRTAHVIVVANEKGGSGKSTLSIHLAVALLKAGYRVATIDLDIRQRTLTRFFENRASWAKTAPWRVELPKHFAPDRGAASTTRPPNSPFSPRRSARSSIRSNSSSSTPPRAIPI